MRRWVLISAVARPFCYHDRLADSRRWIERSACGVRALWVRVLAGVLANQRDWPGKTDSQPLADENQDNPARPRQGLAGDNFPAARVSGRSDARDAKRLPGNARHGRALAWPGAANAGAARNCVGPAPRAPYRH